MCRAPRVIFDREALFKWEAAETCKIVAQRWPCLERFLYVSNSEITSAYIFLFHLIARTLFSPVWKKRLLIGEGGKKHRLSFLQLCLLITENMFHSSHHFKNLVLIFFYRISSAIAQSSQPQDWPRGTLVTASTTHPQLNGRVFAPDKAIDKDVGSYWNE